MAGQSWDLLLVTAHWIGPEMLVDLTIEGRDVSTLADSGSQVNTIMVREITRYDEDVSHGTQ